MTHNSAKFVDLDPMCQSSEFFDFEVQIGHSIRGNMEVAVIQDLWPRIPELFRAPRFSSYLKSALNSLSWIKGSKEDSQFILELQQRTMDFWGKKNGKLSIKFTMDRYVRDRTKFNYTYGEISGTIGPSDPRESRQYHRFSRVLKGLGCNPRQGGNIRYEENFCTGFFHVDYKRNSVLADFSNSFRKHSNGDFNKKVLGELHAIVPYSVSLSTEEEFSKCPRKFIDLGKIFYDNKKFMYDMNSFQEFPTKRIFTNEISKSIQRLRKLPLLIAQISNGKCFKVVLRENFDGIVVSTLAHNVKRLDAFESHSFDVFASKFGVPVENLLLDAFLPERSILRKKPLLDFFCDAENPAINDPQDGVCLPHSIRTDKNGRGILKIKGNNPGRSLGKYRKECHIKSQIYTILVNYTTKNSYSRWGDVMISLNIFTDFPEVKNPTWYENIRDIFTRYAYLYPVMRPFIHLDDYSSVLKKIQPLKLAMSLPFTHHNFMPISRDLSRKSTEMILRWLDNPAKGTLPNMSLDDVKRSLQTAIRFELSTIPLYMTALLSIRPGYNTEAKKTLKHVMIQEMAHTSLAANILNAINGRPIMNKAYALPIFPSPSPNNPDTYMILGPLSKNKIEHIFMEIEKPAATVEVECRRSILAKNDSRYILGYSCPITDNPRTISQLYNNILQGLIHLEEKAQLRNSSIFSNSKEKQLDGEHWYSDVEGKPFAVTNIKSALQAIEQIVEEGEGSDPCNPLTSKNKLSHFYLFSQMLKERDIILHSNESCVSSNGHGLYMIETEYCHNMSTSKTCSITYSFSGRKRPLAAEGIWPMIEDPQIWKYKINSKAHRYSLQFDSMYTKLLKCFHNVFNGEIFKMKNCMAMMYNLMVQGEKLVRTPIEENGDPLIGPNAGPTFSFIDEY